MTVKDLIAVLKTYDPKLQVKVLTTDGNGHCHENLNLQVLNKYIASVANERGYQYVEIDTPILEIS